MAREDWGTCDRCHFGQVDETFSGLCTKYDSIRVADQTCEKFAKPRMAVTRPYVKKTGLRKKKIAPKTKIRGRR
jgi:hypothetical protein